MKDILKKILKAINIFKPMKQVLISKAVKKGVKAAVAVVIGFMASDKFATDFQPVLDNAGIIIDPQQFEAWLLVIFTGVVGGIMNWVKTRYKNS